MKNFERARSLSLQLRASSNIDPADACGLHIAAAAANFKEVRRLADVLAGRFPSFVFGETDVGYFYALAEDFSAAVRWFDRAYRRHDPVLFSLMYSQTTPPRLLQTPGWKSLMSRPDARAWQAAHDRLAQEFVGP
jgi:hypothetical protein